MGPEQLAEALRHGIRERILAPGQPLVQDELAKRFGLSRSPVREALRMLAAEGLVTISPGSGTMVTKLRSEDVAELYELRIAIEPQLAPYVVEHARAADVDRLSRANDTMRGARVDPELWARTNYEFHREMYMIAHRPQTQRILTILLDLVEPYSRLYVEGLGNVDRANAEHSAMIDAVAARDHVALADHIEAHLTAARDDLLALYHQPDTRHRAEQLRDLRG